MRTAKLLAASLIALSLAACGNKEAPSSDPNAALVVKIGQASPLTGPQAAPRQGQRERRAPGHRGSQCQELEIGGAVVTFELLGEDDQADPRQGTTVAQKLIDAKVNGVIGHLNSGTSIPASKLYSLTPASRRSRPRPPIRNTRSRASRPPSA
jgi:branched-chain amino acid transport system substrate-binding protein